MLLARRVGVHEVGVELRDVTRVVLAGRRWRPLDPSLVRALGVARDGLHDLGAPGLGQVVGHVGEHEQPRAGYRPRGGDAPAREDEGVLEAVDDQRRHPHVVESLGAVRAGLDRINRDAKYVAVHDAARPLITPQQIESAFEQCRVHGAAALAQPVNDTLKRADADLLVVGSVDRHQLYAMQTPQIFERKLIEEAYRAVYAENILVTDEVSAVERLGYKVALVLDDDFNLKITYPRDLPVADFIIRDRAKDGR